jgi:hypothetical protein
VGWGGVLDRAIGNRVSIFLSSLYLVDIVELSE